MHTVRDVMHAIVTAEKDSISDFPADANRCSDGVCQTSNKKKEDNFSQLN